MSNKHIDHSKDMYIVGGVALFLLVIAVIAFVLTGSSSGGSVPVATDTAVATSSVTGIDVGTSTVATSTASTSESAAVPASPAVTALAQCLAAKKVTMYGAYWCPHCQDQKKAFGDAFKYVPYVECTQNTQLCLSKGVQGYPTWILANGQKVEGIQELSKLAQISGCSYNQ